ncbi:HalOD1 output domain-containing protein [Haloarculaceae archaeon H-GB2-1]|nr:hypothetical protein [Haloarculaceae archaeon H-GB1-1]MEA5387610.1 HalOD1 output domain-containing protein [Haloarculaceae archaeon H-GB11]MEA5409097.1 HalOD1 output domain-containing protein [Haloarculaceae archaeon H-GB2-1]
MSDSSEDGPTYHYTFDPSLQDPVYDVVETIADLEGVEVDELPSVHETVDGMVDNVFSNPPAPEAQVEVSFTYAGYRIRLHQDGNATFIKVA